MARPKLRKHPQPDEVVIKKKIYSKIAKCIHNNTAPPEEQYNDLSVVGECLIDDLVYYFKKADKSFNEKEFRKECEKLGDD